MPGKKRGRLRITTTSSGEKEEAAADSSSYFFLILSFFVARPYEESSECVCASVCSVGRAVTKEGASVGRRERERERASLIISAERRRRRRREFFSFLPSSLSASDYKANTLPFLSFLLQMEKMSFHTHHHH